VEFEWDEDKRRQVIQDHGLDFEDVVRAFDGPRIVDYDHRHSGSEERWRMLAILDGEVIVVIYTERPRRIRLITARKAEAAESALYYEEFFGEPL